MDDPLLVDRPDLADASDLPAHMRIGDWLERVIVSHTLAPGDKMPSEVAIANAEPIILEEAYLPAAIFPGLLSANLTGSLYMLMCSYGASPFSADEEIEATQATPEQAGLLGIEAGSPLLLITRTSFSDSGVA